MPLLARLLTRLQRRRGVLAVDDVEPEQTLSGEVLETAGTRRLTRPEPTPSMHVAGFGPTAGTPSYRDPGGTPSTRRIHNPPRPGR